MSESVINSNGFSEHTSNLPTINKTPEISGTIRQQYSDFVVTETLSFEPCGEGEHLFLYIEKQSCNTQWVADELQKYFKLRSQDIGYAGKKDRYSLSRQWFSLHLPGKENEVEQAVIDGLNNDSYRVLKAVRHNKKLRKGVIKFNHFKIIVNQLSGVVSQSNIEMIEQRGFPNYFGYQRFGNNGNNLVNALKLFKNQIRVRSRNKKGLYLSAARSYLFNLMLAARIEQGTWEKVLSGDCISLSGSQSYFVCEQVDSEIELRLKNADIHISGLLVGSQKSQATEQALDVEQAVLGDYSEWLEGLDNARLSTARRPMRVIPQDFKLTLMSDNQLEIEFSLPAGCFATSLLRELFIIKDAAHFLNPQTNQRVDSPL